MVLQEFFKQEIKLYEAGAAKNALAPGQYSYSFAYKLPAKLPATFYEEGGDKQQGDAYSCKILYKVKVMVLVHGNPKPVLKEVRGFVVLFLY